MNKINKMIKFGMAKAKRFNAADFALFKICLFFSGLIVGIYQERSIKKFAPFVWVALAISYIMLLYRMFIDLKDVTE